MFESKSKAQVEAERLVMEDMEFFCGGQVRHGAGAPQGLPGDGGRRE